MSMIWRIQLVDKDLVWFVGSRTVPAWENSGSDAQVIIPIEQLGDLTNEEIGENVRAAISHALECNNAEKEMDRQELERYAKESRTIEKKQNKSRGHIYLVHGVGTEWYKIGKSKQLGARMKVLGTQGPFPLEVIHTYPTNDMVGEETFWHNLFDEQRVEGEWFVLAGDDIEYFKGWVPL